MGVLGGVRNFASKAKNWVTDLVDLRSGGSKKLDIQPSYDPSRGTSPASATSAFNRNPYQDILDQNAGDTSSQPRRQNTWQPQPQPQPQQRRVQKPTRQATATTPYKDLAEQRYQAAMEQARSYDPTAYMKELRQEYGIPEREKALQGLTEQVLTTEELLENVEGDVTKGTKGYLVPEYSRRKMVAERRKPLTEELSQLERARARERAGLERLSNLVSNLVNLRSQRQQRLTEPLFERAKDIREYGQARNLAEFKAGLENKYARGTESEREESAAKASLKSDIQNWRPGTTFQGLVNKYGDVLPFWEIVSTYDAYSPYGPHKETTETVRGWLPGEEGGGGSVAGLAKKIRRGNQ